MKALTCTGLLISALFMSSNSAAQYTLSTSSTTTTSSTTEMYATPSRSSASAVQLSSVGAYDTYYYRSRDMYLLYNYYASTTNIGYAEGKPYARLYAYIPSDGNYLVSFRASPGSARMRHNTNGPIVGDWNMSGCNPCDYTSVVRLRAGYNYFYFWANDSYKYVYSATITPYTGSTSTSSTTLSISN